LAFDKQSQIITERYVIFGGLAVIVIGMTLDPWLCVAGFRRFCLYRMWLYFLRIKIGALPDFSIGLSSACPFCLIGFYRPGVSETGCAFFSN